MIKLAITGNIASGKTLVESFLKEEGIPVIDADKIVHNLLDHDKETINEVYELFKSYGYDVKRERGNISREKVGEIVFKDKKKLKQLEEILHPKVKTRINEFFNINKNEKIVAAVIPLLFETGMEEMFDYVITVSIDKDIQVERLIKRSNLTKEEALCRIELQMSQKEKIKKADFVIDNSSNPERTREQLIQILSELRKSL